MKKIILSLVVVFVMSSFTSANTSVENINKKDKVEECRAYSHAVVQQMYAKGIKDYRLLDRVQHDLFVGCVDS